MILIITRFKKFQSQSNRWLKVSTCLIPYSTVFFKKEERKGGGFKKMWCENQSNFQFSIHSPYSCSCICVFNYYYCLWFSLFFKQYCKECCNVRVLSFEPPHTMQTNIIIGPGSFMNALIILIIILLLLLIEICWRKQKYSIYDYYLRLFANATFFY